MEYGAVLHSPYYTLPGTKFTLLVFSCKQYVDMVAARASRARVYIVYKLKNYYSAGTRYWYRTQRNRRSSSKISSTKSVSNLILAMEVCCHKVQGMTEAFFDSIILGN